MNDLEADVEDKGSMIQKMLHMNHEDRQKLENYKNKSFDLEKKNRELEKKNRELEKSAKNSYSTQEGKKYTESKMSAIAYRPKGYSSALVHGVSGMFRCQMLTSLSSKIFAILQIM